MRGVRLARARREVVLSGLFFDLQGGIWRASPQAFRLYVLLAFRVTHDAQNIDGETVKPGQYRRSLRQLARDLHVRDWRVIRHALLELSGAGLITLERSTHQPGAENAPDWCEKRATKNAPRDRKPQLISLNGYSELQVPGAKNVAEQEDLRSSRTSRPAFAGPARSSGRDERRDALGTIADLVRTRVDRTGVTEADAHAAVLREKPTLAALAGIAS
jgi:hypothetical protein